MATYPGSSSLAKYWRMMEEDDDDVQQMVDDDDEEAVQLVEMEEAEGFSQRLRRERPAKEIRPRDHRLGDNRIREDYFVENPVYSASQFRRRFRMRRHVVERLIEAVERVDPYFTFKYDALGKPGLTALQKVVASLRVLAYGVPSDAVDEYVRIGESTAREALQHFCKAVVREFEGYYLRAPNHEDVTKLLQIGEERGFPGMLGSIDCMHWEWKNCPAAWRGMFTGRGKHPTMILEAVASKDLWIWHAYFGMPGSNNAINVLQRSPVFSSYLRGQSEPVSFTVNGNTYNMGYYLADGIYPDWQGFVKTIRHPMETKTKHFAACQEGARKDIERAFGVLQARWGVLRGPAYGWDRDNITDIMMACVIMHNMVVEDEGPGARNTNFERLGELVVPYSQSRDRNQFVEAHHRLRDQSMHFRLQNDLIEHQWMRLGSHQH